MSKRFTNELEPTVEQKEKNRVFSSKFGQKDDEFVKGEYFNALVEFTYFYFKGESFYLTQEGRKKLRMFDSYIDKGILEISFDTDKNDEIMIQVVSLSTSHPILDNNADLIEQMLREFKLGTRQFVYCSPDKPNSKVNQTNHKKFAEALA